MMRRFAAVAALCLAFLALPAAAQHPLATVGGTKIRIVTEQGRAYYNGPVFFSTCEWSGAACNQPHAYANGQWITADLTKWGVPPDAVGVFLSGIMIITGGTANETPDMHWTFRRPGDTADCGQYIAQVTAPTMYDKVTGAAVGGNGARSTTAHFVPLTGGKFEWCVWRSTSGTWPDHASYGLNLSIQAWVEP